MMLLYDTKGNVAGMQSVVPQHELEFQCDGSVNEFYVKEVNGFFNEMTVSAAVIIYVQLYILASK